MKQFFKFVFATIVGLFLFCLLSIFIIAGIASAAGKEKVAKVEANSVLKLDLNYSIPEKSNDNPFAGIDVFNTTPKKAVGLTEIRASIKKAKDDANIKGIYLEMGINDNGYATLEAIRQALLDFKKSGKFVYAYGEVVSQKSYYLATAADKIFVNPNGGLELKGFGREIMYFKGMFDKLGIEVQDFHCGSYKSAIEPFLRENMTDANREQLSYIYSDVYSTFLNRIAGDRKMDTATLNNIVDNLMAESPEKSKALNLVDDILYYDEVVDKMKTKLGIDKKKEVEVVTLDKYASTLEKNLDIESKIAVVYAQGSIVDGEGSDDEIGGEKFAKIFSKLRKDDKVKAVVLRINSGGGSALASDIMWREIVLTKKEKPVVVSFWRCGRIGRVLHSCTGGSHLCPA
ncbi:MAG: S49 family peptidase [Bacteroidetes bacterium]|nr:S49 family peptidase [Bacteroidota bacterium]